MERRSGKGISSRQTDETDTQIQILLMCLRWGVLKVSGTVLRTYPSGSSEGYCDLARSLDLARYRAVVGFCLLSVIFVPYKS